MRTSGLGRQFYCREVPLWTVLSSQNIFLFHLSQTHTYFKFEDRILNLSQPELLEKLPSPPSSDCHRGLLLGQLYIGKRREQSKLLNRLVELISSFISLLKQLSPSLCLVHLDFEHAPDQRPLQTILVYNSR